MRYLRALKPAVTRAFKEHAVGDSAAALTYYAFLSIPSLLLVAVGFFGLFAGPDTVASLVRRVSDVVPAEATTLIEDSLTRVTENRGGGLVAVIVGLAVAAWTVSGAMGAVMRALNRIYARSESRGFVQQRLVGLAMVAFSLVAFALAFGLLVLGPHVSDWTGAGWIWWVGQWPILIGGLVVAFAGIYWLGPNRDRPPFRPVTAGAVLAAIVWLVGSGAFAVYVSMLGSYNKAWGSLAAVIVMLTWLWLSSLALLLGAELDAELEGAREHDNPATRPSSISARDGHGRRAQTSNAALSGSRGRRHGRRG
jgi:membrane protein